MAKIIHTADLHLRNGEEKDYCFSVLDEIIMLAATEKAEFLLISGDLFDSFRDFEELRDEVCKKFKPLILTGCEIIYIPGNHEARGGSPDFTRYKLDNIRFCATLPFTPVFNSKGIEFFCIPHSDNYDSYRSWKIPEKSPGLARIALLHAINSTIYTGPDPEAEDKAGVISDDFFTRFSIDYAAMGHIHSGRNQLLGGALVCYPGSPRVWRAHTRETGQKTVTIIDTEGTRATLRLTEIKCAGQYREYSVPVDLDGTVSETAVKKIESAVAPRDFVSLILTGIIEDENAVNTVKATLEKRFRTLVRKAEITFETKVVSEISGNMLTKTFLAELDKHKPEETDADGYRKWCLARQYGLEKLAEYIAG